MAALTPAEIQTLRQAVARNSTAIHWTKPQVNAALQAIEDQMQLAATKTAIGGVIETAAPGVFNAAEKIKLFAIWSLTFAARQGVS